MPGHVGSSIAPPSLLLLPYAYVSPTGTAPPSVLPLGAVGGASDAFIDVRKADNHLESLRYWHETTKPKLTPAQQDYIQCLYCPEGPRCPVVETKESLKEELEVAKALLRTILPDRCLFRCHLT